MIIGVPKEIKPQESRVALLPSAAYQLTRRGHKVVVEAGAGAGTGFPDEEYLHAGAEIVPFCVRYLDTRGNYSEVPAFIGDQTFWQSIMRVLREKRLVCELTFFPPLNIEGRSRRELALAAEQLVRERIRGYSRQDR